MSSVVQTPDSPPGGCSAEPPTSGAGPTLRLLARVGFVLIWIGMGVALLWITLRRVDLPALSRSLREMPLWAVLGVFALDLLAVISKAGKWHTLLRPVRIVGIARLQAAIYAGGAVSVVLPFRLDEAVRALAAGRLGGVSAVKVLGSMALERLVDVVVLLAFAGVLALALPLPGWFSTTVLWVAVLAGVLTAVLAGARFFSRRDLFGALGRIIEKVAHGSQALVRPRLLAVAAFFSMAEWLLTVQVSAVVSGGVGVDLPYGGLLLTTMLLYASFAIPLVPAGIGAFEWGTGEILPRLYAVSRQQAVTMALAIHALLLAPMLIIGVPVIVISGVRFADVKTLRTRMNQAEES